MSSIDQYKHTLIGFIECSSTYDFVYGSKTRMMVIYELEQDIPSDETHFDGKCGDILLGGGSGEAPAFRLSSPEAFHFFSKEMWNDFEELEDLFKSFWSATETYMLCEGFTQNGWNPDTTIELWLAENLCKTIRQVHPKYSNFQFESKQSALTFINKEDRTS